MYKIKYYLTSSQIEEFNKEFFTMINLENDTHNLGSLDFHAFADYFKIPTSQTKKNKSLRLEFYIGEKIHYVYTLLRYDRHVTYENYEMVSEKDGMILN